MDFVFHILIKNIAKHWNCAFWKAIKKLVPNEKSSTKASTIRIKHDDKLTEDNYTTANAFCNFFCNLAKQMNNELKIVPVL